MDIIDGWGEGWDTWPNSMMHGSGLDASLLESGALHVRVCVSGGLGSSSLAFSLFPSPTQERGLTSTLFPSSLFFFVPSVCLSIFLYPYSFAAIGRMAI